MMHPRKRFHAILVSLLLSVLPLVACSTAPDIEPPVVLPKPSQAHVPEKITFLRQEMVRVVDDSDINGTIQEYVPTGESVEAWSRMFAVRFFPGSVVTPEVAVLNTKAIVDQRAAMGDSFARSQVFSGVDGASFAIDFLISQGTTLEHNIFRYFAVESGVMCYQYARKLSGSSVSNEQLKAFVLKIPEVRDEIFAELNRSDLPVPPEAVDPKEFLERSDYLLKIQEKSKR